MADEVPTGAVLKRFMSEGLDRHDAIHAIATKLVAVLWEATSNTHHAMRKRIHQAMQMINTLQLLKF